jgi:uncharacterized membrane protein
MSFAILVLIPICALYGLSWILFAFVNPPYFLTGLYYPPSLLYFMGILIGVVAPLGLSMFAL